MTATAGTPLPAIEREAALPASPEEARRAFARSGRWRPAEFAFWLVVLGAGFLFPRQLLLLTDVAILALFALSLDLILGYAGILSLGHVAFFGFGAYTAGLLALHVVADPIVGLLVAGAAAGLLGLLSSFLVLRGSDLTRVMITLGVALILHEVASRLSFTGGTDGLTGISIDPLFGLFRFDMFGRTGFFYSLAVLIILFLIARRLVHSSFGLSLRALKDNRTRAAAIGMPTGARLVAIYTIAAVYAGMAGALLAQTTQYVSLDVLAFHRSADALLVLVLGGAGTLYGALAGAIVFKIAQDWIADLTPQYWPFWIGVILIAVVLVRRDRIAGWWQRLWSRRKATAET